MNVDLVKSFRFEAAHTTPAGRGGPTEPHGHSYQLDLVVSGAVDDHSGWLVDYGELTEGFDPFFRAVDHRFLNDLEGLDNVRIDGLRAWALARLEPYIPHLKDVRVSIVGPCAFAPQSSTDDASHAVRFAFEAAHALPNVPPDHKCERMHGHSFTVDITAAGSHEMKGSAKEIYDALDHRCLNEIEGLENPTSEHISRWIWDRIATNAAVLKKVAVAETCTARCEYYGE